MTAKQGVLPLKQDASGGGTVTSVSVAAANGFDGSVANPTTTPEITIETTVTGILKGNGTAVSAATGGDLPAMTSTVGGAVPTPPNDATKFLNGTGAWSSAGTGTVTNTGTLTANQLVIGNGSADVKVLGSAGTTTTVLHGNAAGAPTFGAVSLTADVSGTLPVGNGGTGLTSGTSGGVLAFTGSGTIASSGALTANRLVVGGGAGAAPTVLGSLGTTTTVLHGNASGAPTFSAVSLTADVTGTLAVGNGGTGQTSLTANNVILGNGSSAVQFVAPGTSGNVLTSNGTTWQSTAPSASAPGLVCIAVASASSSATIDFTSGIDSTYEEYQVHFESVIPATNAALFFVRASSDGGSTWASSAGDYSYANTAPGTSGSSANAGDSSADKIILTDTTDGVSNTASHGGISGVISLFYPSGTSSAKLYTFHTAYHSTSSALRACIGGGSRRTTSAVNGIRLYFSTGNITSGLFKLYGVRKSV